jgi:hypothetical protein
MRENVDHRLWCPLALIEIVRVFRETAGVDAAVVVALDWPVILARIVETGPDELAGNEITDGVRVPIFSGAEPALL